MNLKRKIAVTIASSALLFNAFATTAFASTTILIDGNATDSSNAIDVSSNNQTIVTQSNTSNISNNITSDANTGGNTASRNTGGDVSIDTGDATSKVDVSSATNLNSADVSSCGACGGDTTVKIINNGDGSDNDIELAAKKTTSVYQTNDANVYNNVYSDANSGYNKANSNTNGDVSIDTGKATSDVKVNNEANVNLARVGGGHGNNSSGLTVEISGNGDYTDNSIKLAHERLVTLTQDNFADINNYIYSDANSGYNKASRNTGGEVSIDTGDAKSKVDVDNRVNFNAANVDCQCLVGDETVKVANNGDKSDNAIEAYLNKGLLVWQDNCGGLSPVNEWWWFERCALNNNVYGDANSGDNKSKSNTDGDPNGDPGITTGNADSNVNVDNESNANHYGPLFSLPFPDHNGGLDLQLTWDFGMFWMLLGAS